MPAGVAAQAVARLSTARRPGEIARRLNAFHEKTMGPYLVDGQKIRVAVAFKSLHGRSDTSAEVIRVQKALGARRFPELAPAVLRATGTRGTPEDVQRVTQALIDAGALKTVLAEHPGMSVDRGIRQLMKQYGIGVDCIGYTYRAFLYARGQGPTSANHRKYFKLDPGNVQFQQESAFKRAGIADARAGDIIHLKGDRQHNVIVYSNRAQPLDGPGTLRIDGRRVPSSFLKDASSVRVLEVDSSWGDGGEAELGGSAREAWLLNEQTGQWGYWDHHGDFRTSEGPDGHTEYRVLRPRSES